MQTVKTLSGGMFFDMAYCFEVFSWSLLDMRPATMPYRENIDHCRNVQASLCFHLEKYLLVHANFSYGEWIYLKSLQQFAKGINRYR